MQVIKSGLSKMRFVSKKELETSLQQEKSPIEEDSIDLELANKLKLA